MEVRKYFNMFKLFKKLFAKTEKQKLYEIEEDICKAKDLLCTAETNGLALQYGKLRILVDKLKNQRLILKKSIDEKEQSINRENVSVEIDRLESKYSQL